MKIQLEFPEYLRRKNLIILEGIDGSGKSSQLAMFKDYCRGKEIPAIFLFEPTNEGAGRELREIFKRNEAISAEQELKLLLEDRQNDVEKNILPALAEGKKVFLDRYIYSNAIYQGIKLGIDYVLRENIQKGFPFPEKSILLQVSAHDAIKRMELRQESRTYFEKENFLSQAEKAYAQLSHWDKNLIKIDARESKELVFKKILESLVNVINAK